jgi:hypothetical protein
MKGPLYDKLSNVSTEPFILRELTSSFKQGYSIDEEWGSSFFPVLSN